MTRESSTWLVSADDLKVFSQAVLERVGLPANDAGIVADHLVVADLRGVHSHGAVRLPWYVSGIETATINPRPNLRRVRQRRCVGLLDGDNGMGQVVAARGMEWALEMAHAEGIGVVGVRRSNHFGTCAYYGHMAAQQDYIGLVFTGSWPLMAPWGGKEPMLGNHPLAVAIPADEEPPVVLDIATSVVAQGRIALVAKKGESIPEGWALDKEGRPTQDPREALEGLLMPLGGYKGYGLSLVIGILSAVLTGSAISWEMLDIPAVCKGLGINAGHFFMAIDVETFVPLPEFKRRVDGVVRTLKTCPRAEGVERIYVPGEIEYLKEQAYRAEGIPVAAAVMQELRELAARLEVEFLWSGRET